MLNTTTHPIYVMHDASTAAAVAALAAAIAAFAALAAAFAAFSFVKAESFLWLLLHDWPPWVPAWDPP